MFYAASDFILSLNCAPTTTNEMDAESILIMVDISRSDGMPIQLDTVVTAPIVVTDLNASKHVR